MPTTRIAVAPSLAVSLAVLLALTGCSRPQPGTPVAGGTVTIRQPDTPTEARPTTEATTTETATPVDRPKEIDLTTVDICQVVGGLPLREYKLDGDRPPLAGESDLFPGSKDCFANGIRNNVSLLVIAVTTEGARSYVDSANVVDRADSTAAGFPLTVLTPRNPATCLGIVDVHDGQMLYVSYGLGSPIEQPVTPQAELCRTVPVIATAAIGALG